MKPSIQVEDYHLDRADSFYSPSTLTTIFELFFVYYTSSYHTYIIILLFTLLKPKIFTTLLNPPYVEESPKNQRYFVLIND